MIKNTYKDEGAILNGQADCGGVSAKVLVSPSTRNFEENLNTSDGEQESTVTWTYNNPISINGKLIITVEKPQQINLTVYSIDGQEVGHVIKNEMMEVGQHKFNWDASSLPTGVYFYYLKTDDGPVIGKVFISAKEYFAK